MIRLRRLVISGFRGARYPLVVDLTGDCRSIAIFGENASGKSTITDSIEWFFTDRVDHLWSEYCKEEALRNVHITERSYASSSMTLSSPAKNALRAVSRRSRWSRW